MLYKYGKRKRDFLGRFIFAGPREARNPNLDSDQRIAYYACAPRL